MYVEVEWFAITAAGGQKWMYFSVIIFYHCDIPERKDISWVTKPWISTVKSMSKVHVSGEWYMESSTQGVLSIDLNDSSEKET